MLRIVGFTQDRGACTRLRLYNPLKKIDSLGLASTHTLEVSDGDPTELLQGANVVILGRAAGEQVMKAVSRIKAWGKNIVFDMDDNFMEISPMSPHYRQLGIMPVNLERPDSGELAPLWKDGHDGFNVAAARKIRKDFHIVMQSVDCITVTTEPLKKVYSRFHDDVRVVPHGIDFSVWSKEPTRHTGKGVRILYTGAANHAEDFLFVRDPLVELQKRHKDVTIVFIGSDWRHFRSNLDYSRVEMHPWVDYSAYPYLLKSLCCDIGIAPIRESEFNDCRSELKWVEYSALNMATVASDFGSYKRSIRDGQTGLLAGDDEKDWFQKLSNLVTDARLREMLARNAYRECWKKFNLDFTVDLWMNVFRDISTKEIC